MPLHCRKCGGQISPHGILPALDSQGDLLNSDFGHSARVDASTQRRGEQLRTQTHSPHRDVALDQIANVFDLGCQPLDLALIADAHRPAHHDHGVEPSMGRKRVGAQKNSLHVSVALQDRRIRRWGFTLRVS